MPYKQPPKEHQFKKRNPGKPKGARSFKTIFEEAAREVAGALKLGKKPDVVQIELVKRGIKQGLGGDFSFYKDTMDRLYGQSKGTMDLGATNELKEFILELNNLIDDNDKD